MPNTPNYNLYYPSSSDRPAAFPAAQKTSQETLDTLLKQISDSIPAGNTSTLNAAKAHADQRIASLNYATPQQVASGDAATLASAASDATSKANAAEAAAKSYADRQTGDRNVSSLLSNATGTVIVSRVGSIVFLDINGVVPTSSLASGGSFISGLPYGFRPTVRRDHALPATLLSTQFRSSFQFTSGAFGVWSPRTTDAYHLHVNYRTADAWPSTLPGDPL